MHIVVQVPLFAGHPCEHHHYPFNSITPLLSSPIIPTPKSPHLLHNPLIFNLGFSGSCTELGSIQLRDAVKETKQLSKLSQICAIIALLLISLLHFATPSICISTFGINGFVDHVLVTFHLHITFHFVCNLSPIDSTFLL